MARKLSSLPVGTLVRDSRTSIYGAGCPPFRILEHRHPGDPAGSTTLEFRDVIYCGAFDAREHNNPRNDRTYSIGEGMWRYSNVKQWLNSNASAGNWYTRQHTYDNSPTTSGYDLSGGDWNSADVNYIKYVSMPGFLTYLSSELKGALLTVSKPVLEPKNPYDDVFENAYSDCKMFLLSRVEVGFPQNRNIPLASDDTIYEFYKNNNNNESRKKKASSQLWSYVLNIEDRGLRNGGWIDSIFEYHWYYDYIEDMSDEEIKALDRNYPIAWFLRDLDYGWGSFQEEFCVPSGIEIYGSLYVNNFECGFAPAFCLPGNIWVSDEPDSDGCYIINWSLTPGENEPPIVTPNAGNIGTFNSLPSFSVNIVEPENDSYTGVVKLDSSQKDTFTGKSSGTYDVPFDNWWSSMSNNNHTLSISVTDSDGGTTTNAYTFTKSDLPVTFSPKGYGFGSIGIKPSLTIEVSNPGNSSYTGNVTCNGATIQTFSGSTSATHVIDIDTIWNNANYDTQTSFIITITANSSSSSETYTFTKIHSAPTAPTIINMINGMRSDGYICFTLGLNPEDNPQKLYSEYSTDQSFNNIIYTRQTLMKKVNNEWVGVENNITNENIDGEYRIFSDIYQDVTGYIRIKSEDTVTKRASYSQVYMIVGTNLLELQTDTIHVDSSNRKVKLEIGAEIDIEAEVHYYVSNNAYDRYPEWEEYTPGTIHTFANKIKSEDTDWGIAAKVVVDAKMALGTIEITSLRMGVV